MASIRSPIIIYQEFCIGGGGEERGIANELTGFFCGDLRLGVITRYQPTISQRVHTLVAGASAA